MSDINTTTKGYKVIKYLEKNCINDIDSSNGSNIYNIVV